MTDTAIDIAQRSAGTPQERRSGLGGSDSAAALGLSPWATAYELWCLKKNLIPALPVTEPMVWGHLIEPVVRNEYVRRTGRPVDHDDKLIRHPKYDWMYGHLDGRVQTAERRLLEVKTTGTSRGWGEEHTDEVPLHYLIQCHHYLILAEAEICDVAVLIGGQDFRLYEIRYDAEIAASLIEGEREFWRCVVEDEPPDPVNLRDVVRRWGHLAAPGSVIAGDIELAAIEQVRTIRAARAEMDEADEKAKGTILAALADKGDTLIDPTGDILATWKLDRGRKAYEVAARDPQRRFLVKA